MTLLDPLEVPLSAIQGQVSIVSRVEREYYHEAMGDMLVKVAVHKESRIFLCK